MIELEPIFAQVKAGDPIGAAYRMASGADKDTPGRVFYEAGAIALSRRDELGEEALRFARVVFEEAVERDPNLGEAHHDLATTMRELGMAEDAAKHYALALDLMPDDADAQIGLGAALADAGRVGESIEVLKRAVDAHPESGQAYANLGIALEAAGEDEPAVAAYAQAGARFEAALSEATDEESATEAAARRRWTLIQHADLLERLERWPQAIVLFRRLFEEEEAIAEAEAEAEAAAAEAEAEEAANEPRVEDAPSPSPTAEALVESVKPLPPVAVEGGLDAGSVVDAAQSLREDDEDEDTGEEDEIGRAGLQRIFVRLIELGRADLAFLVLDDLGGELSDEASRTSYAIFDEGEGIPRIMAERWDDGERRQLDPVPRPRAAPRRRAATVPVVETTSSSASASARARRRK